MRCVNTKRYVVIWQFSSQISLGKNVLHVLVKCFHPSNDVIMYVAKRASVEKRSPMDVDRTRFGQTVGGRLFDDILEESSEVHRAVQRPDLFSIPQISTIRSGTLLDFVAVSRDESEIGVVPN